MSLELSFFNTPIYNCSSISGNIYTIGKNGNNILIVCNEYEQADISDFLNKIMMAVKTNLLEDTAILNLSLNDNVAWSNLKNSTNASKVIFFGIEPSSLGLHLKFEKYQLLNWNEIKILKSDFLKEIIADKNKKAMLWRELQLMFV